MPKRRFPGPSAQLALIPSEPPSQPTAAAEPQLTAAGFAEPRETQLETLAVRELLAYFPALLAQLPLATTLQLQSKAGRAWCVTTGQATYGELRHAGDIVLTGREFAALAVAAENDRATHAWLDAWLAERATAASVRLDAAAALGGLAEPRTPIERWCIGRVLRSYGAVLERVAIGDGAEREWLA